PPDALERLLHLGRQAFHAYAHRPLVRRLWWPRFEQAARWYLERERERRPTLAALMVEVEGELPLEAPGGPFLLKARADRIERAHDDRLTVIDYKTGAPPKEAEVTSGRQPQLPLEALMVREGAFRGIAPAEVEALWFWSIRGDAAGGVAEPLKQDPARLAASAAEGLMSLIEHYDDVAVGYPARLRPDMSLPRDYDHLARFKEWAG
ncbi:MAG TPA: PD-(D/E)XK nuclease family protein, partial [Geminicoccaceae bacterium]